MAPLLRCALPIWQRRLNPASRHDCVFAQIATTLHYPAIDPADCAPKASLRHQLKSSGIKVVQLAPLIVDTGLGGNIGVGGQPIR